MAANIGKRREFVWDEYMIDTEKTTASRRVHQPTRKEISIVLDKPWEGDGCNYFCTVYDDVKKVYRTYYNGWEMMSPDRKSHAAQGPGLQICCIESADGIRWERPNVGIVDFEGSTDNNIVINRDMYPGLLGIDNFAVTVDANPDKKVPGKYKAVMAYPESKEDGAHENKLMGLASDDGYHFRKTGVVTYEGAFDSLNTVLWHEATGQYICYIRGFHKGGELGAVDSCRAGEVIRDIRVLYSKDFITWTSPVHIDFLGGEDFPLYTNCAFAYPGAEHMLVGFPTRYVERREWTDNFERLCGVKKRAERCEVHPRYGLTTTDCLFMCSRDGYHWYRYDEAFIRPGPEFPANWVYGSCYPTLGLVSSPSDIPGADEEWSMFLHDNHWLSQPTEYVRYAIRKDGFASLHADRNPEKIVTKPFIFAGDTLKINFSTSARGWMYVKIVAEDGGASVTSCELFGDRTNRIVGFDGSLASLAGKSVRMEIELKDADFYAFQFE